jgi:hypothetical protein
MTEIILNNISGTEPIDVYIADYAGNQKQFLATITGNASLPITSSTFNTMSSIMVILSGTNGCELIKITECGVL